MPKIKRNGGLDQYGPERFGRLILTQSEKCVTERVKAHSTSSKWDCLPPVILLTMTKITRLRIESEHDGG